MPSGPALESETTAKFRDLLGEHRQRDRVTRRAAVQVFQGTHRMFEQPVIAAAQQPGDRPVVRQRRPPGAEPCLAGEHGRSGRQDGGRALPLFPFPAFSAQLRQVLDHGSLTPRR